MSGAGTAPEADPTPTEFTALDVAQNATIGGGLTTTTLSVTDGIVSGSLLPNPRTSRDVGFKPYGWAQMRSSVDPTTNTWWQAYEVPCPYTSGKLQYANITASAYVIKSMTVAASSQWGAPGAANTGQMGVSAFDASGTDITATAGTWAICSFGLNGVSGPYITAPNDFTNIAATTTISSYSGANIVVADATGIAIGQTMIPKEFGTTENDRYHVTAVSGTTITLDQTINGTNGATVLFLPITISVPASTQGFGATDFLPALVTTDPFHITSVPRIDGPVIVGETLFLEGAVNPLKSNLTAKAIDATSVTLTDGLPYPLKAGTRVRFGVQVTTSGAITPNNVVALSSATGVAAGMLATFGTTEPRFSQPGYVAIFSSLVKSVASNNVTLTDMIDPPAGGTAWSGTMIFSHTLTVNGAQASNTTVIPVLNDSLLAALATAAGSVTVKCTSTNVTSTGTTGLTISSVDANAHTITLASGTSGALLDGQPLQIYFARTISGTAATAYAFTMALAPQNNVIPGAGPVGPLWKDSTRFTGQTSPTSWLGLQLSKSPTATIASGSSVWVCHAPMVLTQDAPMGATTLTFDHTNYPYPLLLVRTNFTSGLASYYAGPGNDWGDAVYVGLPQRMGGFGNGANDSVLSPNLLTNLSGGATTENLGFIAAMQLSSPIPCCSIMVTGDSRNQGNTTPDNACNFGALACADLWSSGLPMSPINYAWGGSPGCLFIPLAKQGLGLRPNIVVIDEMPNNWPSTTQAYAAALAGSGAISTLTDVQGGLPIMTSGYRGATFGLDTLGSINAYQVAAHTYFAPFGNRANPYCDTNAVVGATFGGSVYLAQQYTTDGLHAALPGHQAIKGNRTTAGTFINLIAPYLPAPVAGVSP